MAETRIVGQALKDLLSPGVHLKFHASRDGNRQVTYTHREGGLLEGSLRTWNFSNLCSRYERGEIGSYEMHMPEQSARPVDLRGHWAIRGDLYCIAFTSAIEEAWNLEVYQSGNVYRFHPVAIIPQPGSRFAESEVSRS